MLERVFNDVFDHIEAHFNFFLCNSSVILLIFLFFTKYNGSNYGKRNRQANGGAYFIIEMRKIYILKVV